MVVKVLQQLLQERVPIRNLRTICESLAELAPKTQDPATLVAAVRVADVYKRQAWWCSSCW